MLGCSAWKIQHQQTSLSKATFYCLATHINYNVLINVFLEGTIIECQICPYFVLVGATYTPISNWYWSLLNWQSISSNCRTKIGSTAVMQNFREIYPGFAALPVSVTQLCAAYAVFRLFASSADWLLFETVSSEVPQISLFFFFFLWQSTLFFCFFLFSYISPLCSALLFSSRLLLVFFSFICFVRISINSTFTISKKLLV